MILRAMVQNYFRVTSLLLCRRLDGVVSAVADAVQALADTTAHAAYLVGVSHPSTEIATTGLVDLGQVSCCV